MLFTLISYLFFSYKYTLFCWKIKSFARCFSQQIKPQTTVHRPLKRHILNPIKHLRWKLMAFSHCLFSQKNSILDVWQGSEYASALLMLLCPRSKRDNGKVHICQTDYSINSKLSVFPSHTWNYNIQANERLNDQVLNLIFLFFLLFSSFQYPRKYLS